MINVLDDRSLSTERDRRGETISEFRPNFHVLWLHDTARRIGGCEQYIVNTVRLLRKRGVRSTLLYGESGRGALDMLSTFDRAFPIVDLRKQLARIQPDVIYAHRISGCDNVKVLAESDIPTLRFFHDHKLFCPREHKYTTIGRQTCTRTIGVNCYTCLGFINRSRQWPGLRIQTVGRLRAEQRAHADLAGYVVASEYLAQHLTEHGFAKAKVHVLPLYAPVPTESEIVTRDRHLLLFVGQVVRGKGLDILLRSLRDTVPSVRLIVVGTGAQLAESKQLAIDQQIADRVDFVGQKSQTELVDLYRKARALVVPSRSPETFGQVGIEAMSYGLPVVATNVGGIGEWLSHETTGLFCHPNDPSSLTSAINRLVTDDAMASRMSDLSIRTYAQKYSPKTHVDRLSDLLAHVSRRKVLR